MTPEETHERTELVQAEIFRRMPGARKLELMNSLSRTVLSLSYRALRRTRPDADETEIMLAFVELNYGAPLATRVRKHVEARVR